MSTSSTGLTSSNGTELIAGTSYTSGVGINVSETVDAILETDRAPETAWENDQTSITNQETELESLQTEIATLQSSFQSLSDFNGTFSGLTATSSDSSAVNATASSSAAAGTHTVVVTSLATTGESYSNDLSSASSTITAGALVFTLGSGAYDFLSKDLSYASLDIIRLKDDLVAKCKAAATYRRRNAVSARVPASTSGRSSIGYLAPGCEASVSPHPSHDSRAVLPIHAASRPGRRFPALKLVCIGTSTGGPKALQCILPMLPANLAVPIAIVQHMPPGFTAPFARRLDSLCQLRVKESEPNEPLLPGVIYIARAGEQFRVIRRGAGAFAHMSLAPANTPHIPSVDILMHSAADQFAQLAMGIILTGMGSDGQQGMAAIYHAGGYTLGEDESTCTVYGMPRACAESGSLHSVLPLEAIPSEIVRLTGCAASSAATVVAPSSELSTG